MPLTNGKYTSPGWNNGGSPAISAAEMQAISDALELTHAYGVCATAAATAAKTVSVDVSGTLTLFAGLSIQVKFSNANTAASPTLNVNGTGARSILISGSAAQSGAWGAGETATLTYDGSAWNLQKPGNASTTAAGVVMLTDSTGSSSTTTAATANSVRQAYSLASSANSAAQAAANKIVASTTPLTPGSSTLASGTLYVVYE